MIDEVPEGKGKARALSEDIRLWLHKFVLDNSAALEDFRE
jgi:hypothetical protein